MVCPSCGAQNDDAAQVCFTCRAVLAVLTRGSVVGGRYEILDLLGRGGMGTVYKVRDRGVGATAALKVLRPEIARAPEMARRFRQETKLARQVDHPNVCRIHSYGIDGDLSYLAMEWIEGTSLKAVLRERGALPEGECLGIAVQIAEGLSAIHAAGIVHRDLTTPNVMLGKDGVVRILDFGIAKLANPEGETHPTAAGYVIGSPEYMSPEQAQGRPVDARTDVYSFGIVLFELATGTVPFRGENPVATLLMHVDAPPLLEAEGISPTLAPILRRALAKKPADRYPTIKDVADDLRASGARTGLVTARSRAAQARRPARRAVALAAVALGLGLAVAWSPWTLWLTHEIDRRSHAPGPTGSPTPARSTNPSPVVESSAPPTPSSSPQSPVPARPREVRAEASSPQPRPSPPPAATLVATPREMPSAPPTPPQETPPTPTPSPEGVASPAAEPSRDTSGALLVLASPWANVAIDGRPFGQTPLARIPLAPGPHAVVLTHPDYQPFPRRVAIRPGETLRLSVDFTTEGVRKR